MTKSWKEIRFISDQVGQLLAFYTEKPVRIRQIAVFVSKTASKEWKLSKTRPGSDKSFTEQVPNSAF